MQTSPQMAFHLDLSSWCEVPEYSSVSRKMSSPKRRDLETFIQGGHQTNGPQGPLQSLAMKKAPQSSGMLRQRSLDG